MAWGSLETGVDAYNGGEYALAMHELLPLAEKGNADAEYFVGQMVANGQGELKNEATAAGWYLQAAGSGNANAQLALADMYAFGRGVAEDDAIAAYWHWRAATTLVTAARRNLSTGLKKSDSEGAKTKNLNIPAASNCEAPSYTRDVQHFGEGGTVDLLFLVDAEGNAMEASILTSSDWPRLDQIARDAFATCTFAPIKVDGKAVPAVVRMPYVWKPKQAS